MPLSVFIPLLFAASLNSPLALDIDRAQAAREEKVTGYTVTETYTLKNSRFSTPAEMVVNVTYVRGIGKTYQVVSRKGPSFLQSTVLDRMLREEEAMSKGELRTGALITSANYQLKPAGEQDIDGKMCERLELTPRRKSPHLLRGQAWVDAATHNLVRIEGKPAASLSFFAGTPQVVREYSQIDGFSFAHRSLAESQSFFLGHSELTIEYTNYRFEPLSARLK